MGYSVSRDFSAPAEVVFDNATDPDRWGRWLPAGLRIERADPGELRVVWADGDERVRWHVLPEEMHASVQPSGRPWSGSLTVVARPVGGSTVRCEIDGVDAPAPGVVERALAHLGEEVADNFNVS